MDAAHIDNAYVEFPKIANKNNDGASPSHRVLKFFTGDMCLRRDNRYVHTLTHRFAEPELPLSMEDVNQVRLQTETLFTHSTTRRSSSRVAGSSTLGLSVCAPVPFLLRVLRHLTTMQLLLLHIRTVPPPHIAGQVFSPTLSSAGHRVR